MRKWLKAMTLAVSFTLACQSATPASAQDSKQASAADFIVSTADRICKAVRSEGTASSGKVQGQINAQVKGLASKLAGLGFEGGAGGEHSQNSYSNVLRSDLPALMVSEQQCRDRVFESLKFLLVPPASSPRIVYKDRPVHTIDKPIYDLSSIHMGHFNLRIGNSSREICLDALERAADANKDSIYQIPTIGSAIAYINGGAKTFITCEGGWVTITVAAFNMDNIVSQEEWARLFVRSVLPEPK